MPAPLLPRPAPDLPMVAALGDTVAALTAHGSTVLVAPPGTGKTTLVPLALADALPGRIVVAEPRRLAARAAATRMAALTGTRLGEEIGFTVRGERRTSRATLVEVVTTGVLLQRLLRDPELPGVAAVVLDECHERHLDADLALAFCVDVRAVLRPDLHLLATSATADVPRIAAALAGDGSATPVVEVAAVTHPLDVVWAPPPRPPAWTPDGRIDREFEAHVAAVTARAFDDADGDVLVFLPGIAEITRLAATLRSTRPGAEVAVLHGSLPAREQDAVLAGADRGRRVVLSSAVAESSVTVPGVRAVVDAGLARLARADPARGLARLVTTRVSRAVAEQRAGRAAREAPGRVYRCWSEADHQRLAAHPEPEIAVADLAGAALALACWGAADGAGLALPDPPPSGPLAAARRLLTDLGAVDDGGAVTERGRRLARVGVHPRLARALVDGARLVGPAAAAEVVAVLADDTRPPTPELVEAVRALRAGRAPAELERRWRQEVRRLRAALPEDAPNEAGAPSSGGPGADVGLVAALAYPDRIGRRRSDGSAYVLTGGSVAVTPPGSALAHDDWLVVADGDLHVDRDGSPRVRIRLAAPLTLEAALQAGDGLLREGREVRWSDGDVVARDVRRLGAVVLEDRPARGVGVAALNAAAREGLRRDGLAVLTWSAGALRLRQRLALCHRWLPDVWPDVGDEALLADPGWLDPGLSRARSAADLRRLDVLAGLRSLLPWSAPAAGPGSLDDLAPERVAVPSGSQIAVDYADPERPVLAVKLQECFGWRQGPRIAGGRVPLVLHLLSPAGRPAAVTADLESFWTSGYPQVRAELRGRYPKHPWPEDPSTVPATRLTSAALRRRGGG